jgi:arsenite methyltransferase
MKEIFRVLKPGGHFSISDIVLVGDLPDALRKDAEMYAGCVSGAVQKEVYLEMITGAGFKNITLQKEKAIFIPDDILSGYLDEQSLEDFRNGNTGIFSITVFGEKPAQCCPPNSGCC